MDDETNDNLSLFLLKILVLVVDDDNVVGRGELYQQTMSESLQ